MIIFGYFSIIYLISDNFRVIFLELFLKGKIGDFWGVPPKNLIFSIFFEKMTVFWLFWRFFTFFGVFGTFWPKNRKNGQKWSKTGFLALFWQKRVKFLKKIWSPFVLFPKKFVYPRMRKLKNWRKTPKIWRIPKRPHFDPNFWPFFDPLKQWV